MATTTNNYNAQWQRQRQLQRQLQQTTTTTTHNGNYLATIILSLSLRSDRNAVMYRNLLPANKIGLDRFYSIYFVVDD